MAWGGGGVFVAHKTHSLVYLDQMQLNYPAPCCLEIMMSLVKEMLKFQMYKRQKHCHFLRINR